MHGRNLQKASEHLCSLARIQKTKYYLSHYGMLNERTEASKLRVLFDSSE